MSERDAEAGPLILTINTGSSSLKAALFQFGAQEKLLFSATAERIGRPGSQLRVAGGRGEVLLEQQDELRSHEAALETLLSWLQEHGPKRPYAAAGHRIVHGGSRFTEPQRMSNVMLDAIEKLVPVDPDHLPQALAAVRALQRLRPELLQVACFDTAFHRQMPRVAQLYALPRSLLDEGLIRYGFHGISYEFIMQKLRTEVAAAEANGRVIVAHLGSGASIAAISAGVSVDTTMGFTPTGGIVMGTRSGDLDPGVLLYLLQARGMTPAALSELVNKRAGLLGVSGVSADMRDLLACEDSDAHAAEAIELFCYSAAKAIASLCVAMDGVNTLIFTAGVGEHAAPVRQRICDRLGFLGIRLDIDQNNAHAAIISAAESRVTVRVMHTDEELMIARHTRRLLAE